MRNLQTQGRIRTAQDTTDGRAKLLILTDLGRTELEGWRSRAVERLAAGLGAADKTDDAALQRALGIITSRRGLIEKA